MLEYSIYLARAVVSALVVMFMLLVNTDTFVLANYRKAHVGVAIAALLDFYMDVWGCWMIWNGIDYFRFHWVWAAVYYVEWTVLGYCVLRLVDSKHTFYWFPPLLIYYVLADSKVYRAKVDDYYAGSRNERLHGLSYSSPTFFMIYLILTLLDLVIFSNKRLDAAMVALSTVVVVWLTIRILNLRPAFAELSGMEAGEEPVGGTADVPEIDDTPEEPDMDNIESRVLAWEAREDKPFCEESVSLVSVADAIRVTPRALSSYINSVRMINFNTWINNLRIEEVKRMIRENPSVDILDLMVGTGFQSRSSLSRAVKAATGLTVTELKSRL